MIKGKIHSIESMGLVDGPGIRTVVFFQGCSLRCLYCHNPDTWSISGGKEYTPEELLKKILRFKPYFDKSNGGVTFSGGEVLLQAAFLIEILKLCKENGIHTTIDTAGYGNGQYEDILKYVDLVLLDVKQFDDTSYRELTGKDKKGLDKFIEACNESNVKLWIRHVVVPGRTDTEAAIDKLAKVIKNIKNIEKIELLPYHTLGVEKYKKLGIEYKLENIPVMDREKCKELEDILKNKV